MSGIPEVPLSLTLHLEQRPLQSHSRSRLLRNRLLLVLGLGVSAVASAGCIGMNCPDYASTTLEVFLDLGDKETSCPAEPAQSQLMIDEETRLDERYAYDAEYTGGNECGPAALLQQEGTICTYTITCEPWSCCGYGRPYLDEDGNAVAATSTPRTDWSEPVSVSGALSDAEREQLVEFWLKNAAAEHSSVAGFHRFALDLLAHGAPPALVRRAGEAAAQEISHAVDCFSLASVYAQTRLGPAPLKLGTAAPVASTLAQLAAWTVRDGVVGETIAAYLAAEALDHATDPEVRRVLSEVVRDETAHAELAWETLVWALEVGDHTVMDAVRAVFNSITYPTTPLRPSSPATRAHGLLSPQQQDAAARRCIDEVIRPVMASLLSRALAA